MRVRSKFKRLACDLFEDGFNSMVIPVGSVFKMLLVIIFGFKLWRHFFKESIAMKFLPLFVVLILFLEVRDHPAPAHSTLFLFLEPHLRSLYHLIVGVKEVLDKRQGVFDVFRGFFFFYACFYACFYAWFYDCFFRFDLISTLLQFTLRSSYHCFRFHSMNVYSFLLNLIT